MSNFDLERLSVLVVEDAPFMSTLMYSALKALGVGTIKSATDGGDAIELFKVVKKTPSKAGIMTVDLVISNWQMSPIDGLMLLRWIRRHPDSLDRFMPFIMVTAHSDGRSVRAARDMGVTEFLTKPYSVSALATKMVQVIERPRQFVQTADYFGPDRRRNKRPHKGEERRVLTDKSDGVEVVYG
ncbi:MAG: response regulator [Pseudomonadota bacterium]